ncbi:MAG: T9SS type A sorting domain-containing protein [Bacteroidota bacterium]|nr:T9SS type A sorting domain-containing protein [Bacteroidota bacterium]MDP3145934.1 T9SS type A sorting domain-containing protein [Bacteroidota bacterium]
MNKILLFLGFLPFSICSQSINKKITALFLGNSYTAVNNLPSIIYNLGIANGDTLVYDSNTPGGYTLNNHFNDLTSKAKINSSSWDYVIVQAQSQEPSFSTPQVFSQTLPYALKLDSLIKANNACTNTVFFETWGRKNGDASNCATYPPVCTYLGMQDRLKLAYKKFADTTSAIMSPVGEAFRQSIALNSNLELYQLDESHPSIEGSYLAACVFYEVLFQKSVLSNTFISSVNSATASFLQQVAHNVVNDSLAVWNLGKNLPWADYNYNNISGLNYQFTSHSPLISNKWYFGDASTSTQANPIHNYLAAGTYTVIHVVNNACKKDSVLKVLQINSTGINKNGENTLSLIYPNPVKEYLNIKGLTNFDNSAAHIEIRNILGQLVLKSEFNKTINTRELDAGLYSLKIYNNQTSLNFQFIKID